MRLISICAHPHGPFRWRHPAARSPHGCVLTKRRGQGALWPPIPLMGASPAWPKHLPKPPPPPMLPHWGWAFQHEFRGWSGHRHIVHKKCHSRPFLLPFYSHSSSHSWQLIDTVFSIFIILSFQECYINEITQYITFGDCFFSLSRMPLRIPHVILHPTKGGLHSIRWIDRNIFN